MIIPSTSPIKTIFYPCQNTNRIICERCAPRAIRIPISRMRRLTKRAKIPYTPTADNVRAKIEKSATKSNAI